MTVITWRTVGLAAAGIGAAGLVFQPSIWLDCGPKYGCHAAIEPEQDASQREPAPEQTRPPIEVQVSSSSTIGARAFTMASGRGVLSIQASST
jgi:hypothetical protein